MEITDIKILVLSIASPIICLLPLLVPLCIWCTKRVCFYVRLMLTGIGKDKYDRNKLRAEYSQGVKSRTIGRGHWYTNIVFQLACLLLAVFLLRYSVGYHESVAAMDSSENIKEETVHLTPHEEIFNSFIHTLQTFSMDEDYTDYLEKGKNILSDILGNGSPWVVVYGGYVSLLNVVSPIVGGAFILAILSNIFPKIKIWLLGFVFWKKKYYFSSLNEASLAYVRNSRMEDNSFLTRPVMIFTDAYADYDSETVSELIQTARAYGAICIKDDIVHVNKMLLGKKKFFLIDEAEAENLNKLTRLSKDYSRFFLRCFFLKKSEIFLFSQDDAYVQVERSVRELLMNEYGVKTKQMPQIIPVKRFHNMISNLLVDIPLYEPLIGRERDKDGKYDLNVTVIGAGAIGIEMFLTSYWFGQIKDCRTTLSVVSRESREEFEDKINSINPEILSSMEKDNELLRINDFSEYSEPYCYFQEKNYIQCDINTTEFSGLLDGNKSNVIVESDYILIALGTDEDNIRVANAVLQGIGRKHLLDKAAGRPVKNVVIAYVVYNADLVKTLNKNTRYSYRENGGTCEIYMKAVGSFEEMYSDKTLRFGGHESKGNEMGNRYNSVFNIAREKAGKRADSLSANYEYWSSIARAMHIKYKAFSLGYATCSLFEGNEKEYVAAEAKMLARYESFAFNEGEENALDRNAQLQHYMAWLEHRRWVAFARIMGYRWRSVDCPNAYAVYGITKGRPSISKKTARVMEKHRISPPETVTVNHKQMELRLHPCIVECDTLGYSRDLYVKKIKGGESILIVRGVKNSGRDDLLEVAEKTINDLLRENNKVLYSLDFADGMPENDKAVLTEWRGRTISAMEKNFKKFDYSVYDFKTDMSRRAAKKAGRYKQSLLKL